MKGSSRRPDGAVTPPFLQPAGSVRVMPATAFVDRLNDQIASEFGAHQQYVAIAVLLRRRDAPAPGGLLLRPGARGAQPRDDDGPVPHGCRRGPGHPGRRRAPHLLRRHRRAGAGGPRAGAPRLRPDRGSREGRARGGRLPLRAVHAVVPQGAGRGGRHDVRPAAGGRARPREPDVRRGLPRPRDTPARGAPTRRPRRPPEGRSDGLARPARTRPGRAGRAARAVVERPRRRPVGGVACARGVDVGQRAAGHARELRALPRRGARGDGRPHRVRLRHGRCAATAGRSG